MNALAFLIILLMIFISVLGQNKTPPTTSFKIEDHRPRAILTYNDQSRDLAEYFLETLGNSDSVSTKLIQGAPAPTLIVQTKTDQTIIRNAIRTAINDLT